MGETPRNAALAWGALALLALAAVAAALDGSYRWLAFSGVALAIALAPAIAVRDRRVMPPWPLLGLLALPALDASVLGASIGLGVATYVAVATLALLIAAELHLFTPLRMTHSFAVALVVIATLAAAGAWNVAQWLSDLAFDTTYLAGGRSQDAANRAMMVDFAYAGVAGLFAGVVFDRLFLTDAIETGGPIRAAEADDAEEARHTPDRNPRADRHDAGDDATGSIAPTLLRSLDVPDRRLQQFSRAMQVVLAALFVWGLVRRDVPTIANAGVALAITFLPAVLERDYSLPLEPGLVFWITIAVFLHSLGSAGLYGSVAQFDSLTHTLSATVVAAAGYAVVRAIDLHASSVYLPPNATFALILLFVLAAGVVWELVEFAIDQGTQRLGMATALAQHGVDDTATDLLYNLLGGVVAALWGSIYLAEVSHRLADRLGDSERA